ncbi:MAG: hypothetical protein AB1806_00160 [Acidobacteriota bacterium]
MSPLRIAVVYPHLLNRGGCETVLRTVVRLLATRFEFHAVTLIDAQAHDDPEYQTLTEHAGGVWDTQIADPAALTARLRDIDPDVVRTGAREWPRSCRPRLTS